METLLQQRNIGLRLMAEEPGTPYPGLALTRNIRDDQNALSAVHCEVISVETVPR
jgi:hypothetical protein